MRKLEELKKALAAATIRKVEATQEYKSLLQRVNAQIKGQLGRKAEREEGEGPRSAEQ